MTPILETTKAVIRSNYPAIKKASSILQRNFNLNNFYYYRIDELGNYFLFDDNPDVVDSLEARGFIHHYAHYCHPKFHHSMCKVERTNENPDLNGLESIKDYFLSSSFNLALRMVNRTWNTVEEFGFHSAQSDEKQHRCLLNHLQELQLFARWFLSENAHSISFLKENALSLPQLVGSNFYRNRIQESDPVYTLRQKLLKELEIKSEPKFTRVELDTLQLLIKGCTAEQISRQLYRSKRTIEHRIENLKIKMQVSSKSELVQKANEMRPHSLLMFASPTIHC